MNLSIKISRSQFIESSFGDRDKKPNANIIRREGNKCDPRKEENQSLGGFNPELVSPGAAGEAGGLSAGLSSSPTSRLIGQQRG